MQPSRRGFLTGLASLITAPAIVKFDSIMPVKLLKVPKLISPGVSILETDYSPVIINLVRRYQPVLLAYDLVGAQDMITPRGEIFKLGVKYA